jgi:hypothetical protein
MFEDNTLLIIDSCFDIVRDNVKLKDVVKIVVADEIYMLKEDHTIQTFSMLSLSRHDTNICPSIALGKILYHEKKEFNLIGLTTKNQIWIRFETKIYYFEEDKKFDTIDCFCGYFLAKSISENTTYVYEVCPLRKIVILVHTLPSITPCVIVNKYKVGQLIDIAYVSPVGHDNGDLVVASISQKTLYWTTSTTVYNITNVKLNRFDRNMESFALCERNKVHFESLKRIQRDEHEDTKFCFDVRKTRVARKQFDKANDPKSLYCRNYIEAYGAGGEVDVFCLGQYFVVQKKNLTMKVQGMKDLNFYF